MHLALLLYLSLVNDVRTLIARHDVVTAERLVRSYQSQLGKTPELAAAISWLARASLDSKQYDRAENYAEETRKLSLELMKTRKLDADPWLPTALGASIEVHATALAARGERSEAVAFLREEIAAYGNTSIGERIHKDLNLLSMEGKPALPLDLKEWIGTKPAPLAAYRGKPLLLFFWAHWCGDCKAEGPILASVMKTWGPKGLTLLAPTRRYGYVAQGEPAAPVTELHYIEQVQQQYYPNLNGVPMPLSEANFLNYGCSTTPTIVLIDRAGIVRYYHPGAATEAELTAQIQKVLSK